MYLLYKRGVIVDIYYNMAEEVTVLFNVDVGGCNRCISCIMVEGVRNVFTGLWCKEVHLCLLYYGGGSVGCIY